MACRKSVDQHKTRVGKRRKAIEAIMIDVLRCSEHRLSASDKADLWDRMVEAAKAVFAASGNNQQKGGAV